MSEKSNRWLNTAIGALISGVGLWQSTRNRKSQEDTNEADREWQEKMYYQQLADEKSQWHLQNQYNHPSSQMKRFSEAGLNPHLIYGQNNVGAPISVPGVGNWNPKAPEMNFDPTAGIHAYNNMRQASAQVDNLKAQNTVLQQDAILRAAQTQKTVADTKVTDQSLRHSSELHPYSLDAAKLNLEKTITENQISKADEARRAEKHPIEVGQMVENLHLTQWQKEKVKTDILNLKYEIEKKGLENDILRIHRDMWEAGQSPNDPAWQRQLLKLFKDNDITTPEFWQPKEDGSVFDGVRKAGTFWYQLLKYLVN